MSEKLQWRVHTPSLLSQVLDNPGTQILEKPLQIIGSLLASVGERAAELNDPRLNALMIRLTIYSCADPESTDYDPARVDAVLAADPGPRLHKPTTLPV